MTDQSSIRDDIAFLKGLAEEGRQGPMIGGSVLVASGLLFGSASLAIWVALTQGAKPQGGVMWVWPAAAVLFFAYLFVFLRGVPRVNAASQATGIAWSGAGWAMFTVVASLMLIATRAQAWEVAAAISPMILALYGCAWFVAGRIYRSLWVTLVAFASFGMALVNAWYATEGATGYLIYGVTLYLLAALPGFVLVRQASRAR